MALPKNPVMLLSFVNTQLRDNYSGLKELAAAYDIDVIFVHTMNMMRMMRSIIAR